METSLGLTPEMIAKLRRKAEVMESDKVQRLRKISTPALPALEPQQYFDKNGNTLDKFGSVSLHEADTIAAISKATNSEIILVGSSVADPDKVLKARLEHGDTVVDQNGNRVARPISDFDFLVRPPVNTAEAYDQVFSMLQKYVVDNRQSPVMGRADYFPMTPGRETDPNKPELVFKAGKFTSYSSGTETYYTPTGGAVKIVKTLAPENP